MINKIKAKTFKAIKEIDAEAFLHVTSSVSF
jgi:hypothetical protein